MKKILLFLTIILTSVTLLACSSGEMTEKEFEAFYDALQEETSPNAQLEKIDEVKDQLIEEYKEEAFNVYFGSIYTLIRDLEKEVEPYEDYLLSLDFINAKDASITDHEELQEVLDYAMEQNVYLFQESIVEENEETGSFFEKKVLKAGWDGLPFLEKYADQINENTFDDAHILDTGYLELELAFTGTVDIDEYLNYKLPLIIERRALYQDRGERLEFVEVRLFIELIGLSSGQDMSDRGSIWDAEEAWNYNQNAIDSFEFVRENFKDTYFGNEMDTFLNVIYESRETRGEEKRDMHAIDEYFGLDIGIIDKERGDDE